MSSLVDNWNNITPASFQPSEGYTRLEEDEPDDKVRVLSCCDGAMNRVPCCTQEDDFGTTDEQDRAPVFELAKLDYPYRYLAHRLRPDHSMQARVWGFQTSGGQFEYVGHRDRELLYHPPRSRRAPAMAGGEEWTSQRSALGPE